MKREDFPTLYTIEGSDKLYELVKPAPPVQAPQPPQGNVVHVDFRGAKNKVGDSDPGLR